jgi:LCP family protein required for cell wall assembly
MDFAKSEVPKAPARRRTIVLRPWFLIPAFLLTALLSTFIWTSYQPSGAVAGQEENSPGLITQLGHLITSGDREIAGEEEDRVNILLLGIGGAGHQGAYLADTIIVASLRPSTKSISMLSVPRDLAVPILDYGYRKINNALAFGEQEDYPGGGEQLIAEVVEEATGLPIHYWARVDFQGFIDVVDLIEGVTVDVERSFVDSQYPTENYGYQTVRFSAGRQVMDGVTALKYVRSRHGNNGEGSDFARAARQQQVLAAVREKLLTVGTLLNPKRISGLIDAAQEHFHTNLELWEMARAANLIKEYDTEHVITEVLDNSPGGLLKTQIGIDGAYLLVPKAGDFSEIQFLAAHIFEIGAVGEEDAAVMVQNGSGAAGLAGDVVDALEPYHISARLILESAPSTGQTVLYDFTGGAAPATANLISALYHAQVVAGRAGDAETIAEEETEAPDFLLILGTDQVTPRQLSHAGK